MIWELSRKISPHITALEIDQLCAKLTSFVKGRRLEDDANLLIRYKGGAKWRSIPSQISAGEENTLRIRVWFEGFT